MYVSRTHDEYFYRRDYYMAVPKIFESEYRFCEILWENEPVNSTKLVKLSAEKLGWTKGTTYTVIRRLSERGVLKNEDTIVTSVVSRDEAQRAEIDGLVERTFGGSLPQFIAAFTKGRKLTDEEIASVRKLIDGSGERKE